MKQWEIVVQSEKEAMSLPMFLNTYVRNLEETVKSNTNAVQQVQNPQFITGDSGVFSYCLIYDENLLDTVKWKFEKMAVGNLVYTDRNFTFTHIPIDLRDSIFISPANVSKWFPEYQITNNIDPYPLCLFQVKCNAYIFVAFDARHKPPNWFDMTKWSLFGAKINTSENLPYEVYIREVTPQEIIHLGSICVEKGNIGMYIITGISTKQVILY